MEIVFYDRFGRPVAYSDDEETIYSFGGRPLAYFHGNAIYAYSGRHLGLWESGWVRDAAGRTALFSEAASGAGPVKPVRAASPAKSAKGLLPLKGARQILPVRAVNALAWADYESGEAFFK